MVDGVRSMLMEKAMTTALKNSRGDNSSQGYANAPESAPSVDAVEPPVTYSSKAPEEWGDYVGKYIPPELTAWLEKWGFFDLPAASQHGFYKGGLYEHSVAVTDTIIQFCQERNVQFQMTRSPYIVGMFHDICMVDRNIMDENGGFSVNDNPQFGQGHGNKSATILQQFIPDLTEEERLAIAFHMGSANTKSGDNVYESSKERGTVFEQICAKYPSVAVTHDADYYCSIVQGI